MRVTIIGGSGRMGQWFVKYFIKNGDDVTFSDIEKCEAKAIATKTHAKFIPSNSDAVADAELVLISTPIKVITDVLKEISGSLSRDTCVMEISSLKKPIISSLKRIAASGPTVISAHPLFGAGFRKMKQAKIAMVPVMRRDLEERKIRELFPWAKITVIDVENHDRFMALTLSLTHFVNIVFASIVSEEDLDLLENLGGSTFTLQSVLSEGIMTEDPVLYAAIQMENTYTKEYMDKFLSRARTFRKYVLEKNLEDFVEFYSKIKQPLLVRQGFSDAYNKMYKALESVLSDSHN